MDGMPIAPAGVEGAKDRADNASSDAAAQPIRIVHLSDLHLKPKPDYSWTVWESLRRGLLALRPQMVLITGDLADSPSRQVYQEIGEAIEALDRDIRSLCNPVDTPVVWTCAGNHDRHWRGNAFFGRAKTHFDAEQKLQAHVPGVEGGHSRILGRDENRWPIRVFSVDTSRHARRSAQAFLPPAERRRVRELWTADAADPPRLVIMLFHHHLLPLPASEAEEQSWGSLVSFSNAVNPGRILEDLAASQVDLVLHGHEHHVNRARYASYARETGQVAMIAAGSATGMRTLEGCRIERGSFNLIELRPDRSVWCQEIHGMHGEPAWRPVGEPIELLDPTTLRQNMYLRAIRQQRRIADARRRGATPDLPEPATEVTPDEPASEYAKHFVLTPTRDAQVTETRKNWRIEKGRFTVVVQNETGIPSNPAVFPSILLPDESEHPLFINLTPVKGGAGAWSFGFRLPKTETPVAATTIRTSYLWQDAVILSHADFELTDETRRGVHRSEGLEFVAAEIDRPLRSLTLSVSFPPRFLPDERSFQVFTQRLDRPGARPDPEPSLAERLQIAGQTVVLMLPYPLPGFQYDIAWKPAVGPIASELARALWTSGAASEIGNRLVESCLTSFAIPPWQDRVSVAAYVPMANPKPSHRLHRRIGLAGYRPDGESPPPNIDLRSAPSLYRSAWWNDPVVAQADDSAEERLEAGMLPSEDAVAYAPVSFSGDLGPPAAVLRVGLNLGRQRASREMVLQFETMLARAQVRAISSVLQEV
jgi:UDP-2,3-diacylglucosamine pyrophosphatase LpxH